MTGKELLKYIDDNCDKFNQLLSLIRSTQIHNLYVQSIHSFLNAREAMMRSEYANYKLFINASKVLADNHGYAYNMFIHKSYEHYLAEALIYAILVHFKEISRGTISKYEINNVLSNSFHSSSESLFIIYDKEMKGRQTALNLNDFINSRSIQIEYYMSIYFDEVLRTIDGNIINNFSLTPCYAKTEQRISKASSKAKTGKK